MTKELTTTETKAEIIEKVVIGGDLSKLSAEERVSYYRAVCESLGLNPLTKPFDYITLNGKLTLYAKKDATDQLRDKHNVSTFVVSRERIDDIYVVTVHATLPNGRQDKEIGAVSIAGLKGEALANAMMKAGTKAKRRVTLSIVGLGMLDETEVETITMTSATIMPSVTVTQQDAPKPTSTRPLAASDLIATLRTKDKHYKDTTPIVTAKRRSQAAALDKLFDGDGSLRKRFTTEVFGVGSTTEMTGGQAQSLFDWMGISNGGFEASSEYAQAEARNVVNAALDREARRA